MIHKCWVLTFCFYTQTFCFLLCEAESSFERRKWLSIVISCLFTEKAPPVIFKHWDELFNVYAAWFLISYSKEEVYMWTYVFFCWDVIARGNGVNLELANLGKQSRLPYLHLLFLSHTKKFRWQSCAKTGLHFYCVSKSGFKYIFFVWRKYLPPRVALFNFKANTRKFL